MLSITNVLPYKSKYAKRNYVKDNTLFIQIGIQTADIYNKTYTSGFLKLYS